MADHEGGPTTDRTAPIRGREPAPLQRAAEAFVRRNRFTISVVFPAVGAVLLVASAEGILPGPLSFNPYLVLFGTAVMRLPLLVGIAPLVDRRAGAALAGLVGYAYLIEVVGVATGWPYGEFVYLVELGPMVAGVPLGLPIFFVPLVINSFLLAQLLLGNRRRVLRGLGALAALLTVDLALDPGAVALGFWAYRGGGAYYGVPLSNYAGWLLSGAVGIAALTVAFGGEPRRERRLRDRLATCEFLLDDFVSFVLLWGVVNALYGNWIPVALAVALAGLLARTSRFSLPRLGG